jgi:hypothetical protein
MAIATTTYDGHAPQNGVWWKIAKVVEVALIEEAPAYRSH